MFNCIESSALVGMCRALGLLPGWFDKSEGTYGEIYIVNDAAAHFSHPVEAFKLSDYLLATAPVDVKEA